MQKIDDAAAAAGRTLELLVQVDLAGEPTKHGAREADLLAIFDAARGCAAVAPVGLMLLPPAADDPEEARPYFRALRALPRPPAGAGVDRSMLASCRWA